MGLCNSKQKMTIEQVNKSYAILLLLGDKIIDATSIYNFHPGGQQAIMEKKGKDIRNDFRFHSKEAQKLILHLHIADLQT